MMFVLNKVMGASRSRGTLLKIVLVVVLVLVLDRKSGDFPLAQGSDTFIEAGISCLGRPLQGMRGSHGNTSPRRLGSANWQLPKALLSQMIQRQFRRA